MQSAVAAGRTDQVTRLANLLKGAARRTDAIHVYNLAALIESMGVDDKLDEITVTMALLKTEMSREHD
jgi:HPt (histidine-containing phosphotransfer) domain-containing protein